MDEKESNNTYEEYEDEAPVSMLDVLEEEEKLQADADAVLGGSDDRNCTYLMGSVDRQALYSCKTCALASSNKEAGGVCLACSLECHEGHELIELYTKRNFRCDCGNSKFGNFTCKLCPEKMPINPENQYNHNYQGLYCICSRPYPDPEDSVEDLMIQCVICEDWFHMRHVATFSVEDEFDEMTCGSCMETCKFLWPYVRLCKAIYEKDPKSKTLEAEGDADILSDVKSSSTDDRNPLACVSNISETLHSSTSEASVSGLPKEVGTTSLPVEPCRLDELCDEEFVGLNGAVFWLNDWRKQLCKCAKCMATYENHNVLFLLQEFDTIAAYEERGKAKPSKTSYDRGLEALSKLNHVQQVDLIQGYNDLQSHLSAYLQKFADNKKVVRPEDVNEFFAQMASRKRQKTGEMQYYCK